KEPRRNPRGQPRPTRGEREHTDRAVAFEALPPAPDVDRLPALVDQVDRDGGEQHDWQDDDEARAQRSRLLGAEAEKRTQDQRQQAGEQIAEARRADGQEPADAAEVNALVGPALLDHEPWSDDGRAP